MTLSRSNNAADANADSNTDVRDTVESDEGSANADWLRLVKIQGCDLSGEISDDSENCAEPGLKEKVKLSSKKSKSKSETPAKGTARSMRKKLPDGVKGITHSEGEEAQVNQLNSNSEKKNEQSLSTVKPYKRALEFWNQKKVSKMFNIMRTVQSYRRALEFWNQKRLSMMFAIMRGKRPKAEE